MFIILQHEAFLLILVVFFFVKGQLLIASHKITHSSLLDIKREVAKLAFLTYIVFAMSKVYFPLTIAWGDNIHFLGPVIWLRPIWSLLEVYRQGGIYGFIYQIGGNLILLTPLTFFLCYFNEKKYFNLKKIIPICLVTTLFIEFSQLILSLLVPNTRRYFEINDIIFNTLSGVWGYYLYILYKKILFNLRLNFQWNFNKYK